MMRRATLCGLAACMLMLVGCGKKEEIRYYLRKEPLFRAGDIVRVRLSASGSIIWTDGQNKPFQDSNTTAQAILRQEVLQTDQQGNVLSFRESIEKADKTVYATIPKDKAFRITTRLDSISGVVQRIDGTFKANHDTLISTTIEKLTAPQIDMLKQAYSDRMTFHGLPRAEQLLLPQSLVSIGQSWIVPDKHLAYWGQISPHAQAMAAKPKRAALTLQRVDNSMATITGTIEFHQSEGQTNQAPQLNLTAIIDIRSGQWVQSQITRALDVTNPIASIKVRSVIDTQMAFTPGTGQPSRLPAKTYKIGWPEPEIDRNNYRSPSAGISLNIRPPFAQSQAQPKGNIIAQFNAGPDATLVITSDRIARPATRAELTELVVAALQASRKDYQLNKQSELTLPDNVPGMLLTGRLVERNATIVTVFAIDRGRLVNVTIGVPTNQPHLVETANKIATSLRVFEPVSPGNSK